MRVSVLTKFSQIDLLKHNFTWAILFLRQGNFGTPTTDCFRQQGIKWIAGICFCPCPGFSCVFVQQPWIQYIWSSEPDIFIWGSEYKRLHSTGANAIILLTFWILLGISIWKEELQEVNHVLRSMFHHHRM